MRGVALFSALLGERSAEVSGHALRAKAKRPRTRFEAHAPVTIDYVEPVGPARIGTLGGIIKRVDDCGKLDTQFHDAKLADLDLRSSKLLGLANTMWSSRLSGSCHTSLVCASRMYTT